MKDMTIASQLARIADALEALARVARAKEKENLPPTPPIREKEGTHTNTPRACVCEGFLVPTLAEVAAYVKANGLSVDAEKFWNHYNAIGWRVGKSPIRCWQSVCRVWERGDRRTARIEAERLAHFDAKAEDLAARRTAHIDAKMDERERKRERRTGSGQEDLLAQPEAASAPVQGMKSGHAKIFSLFRESRFRWGFGRCPKPLFASS